MDNTKQCDLCKRQLPRIKFWKRTASKDGLRFQCKACIATYNQSDKGKAVRVKHQRKYRRKHRAEINEYQRAVRQTIKGCLRSCFHSLRQRCNNSNNSRYKDYGGRGIECRFTDANDFICFVMSVLGYNMIEKLAGLQIDRINNDGHYQMGNIRFVTQKINRNNRRSNVKKASKGM